MDLRLDGRVAERRHPVRFHLQHERERRGVAVLVRGRPRVGGARRCFPRGASDPSRRSIEGQPRRQRRRQRVGQLAVAVVGRRQRQRFDRAADAMDLRLDGGIAEGGHLVGLHFDGEAERGGFAAPIRRGEGVGGLLQRLGGGSRHQTDGLVVVEPRGERWRERVAGGALATACRRQEQIFDRRADTVDLRFHAGIAEGQVTVGEGRRRHADPDGGDGQAQRGNDAGAGVALRGKVHGMAPGS